jgi:excisionase family DNA binding protein
MEKPLLLRAGEVCRLLHMSEGALYMAVRRGRVPARRLGGRIVFLKAELEQWLANLPTAAGGS